MDFSHSNVIPGPAGVVQSNQRRLDRELAIDSQSSVIPTQEYIQRAIEDPGEDEAFNLSPWLSAMEFLTAEGTYYPLNSIKKLCYDVYRADQVVAVVKSCRSNGLGDLIVTLKDPTDTIEASAHHKVLTKSPFRKDICVGSVLLLQKVAVFKATPRSKPVLNITFSNVFKVFPKC